MPIDYRALLVKYMAGVLSCEGVAFEDCAPRVSPDEAVELQKILEEACALCEAERL